MGNLDKGKYQKEIFLLEAFFQAKIIAMDGNTKNYRNTLFD